MTKTLGYLITWTTYGTWLQGDKRGYVKNGKVCPGNKALLRTNEQLKSQDSVKLSKIQRMLLRKTIMKEAELQNQTIYALAILPTHIHIVAGYVDQPISKIVAYYKKAGRIALKTTGHSGKAWTRGYDKRFCFDQATLGQKIKYVQDHDK